MGVGDVFYAFLTDWVVKETDFLFEIGFEAAGAGVFEKNAAVWDVREGYWGVLDLACCSAEGDMAGVAAWFRGGGWGLARRWGGRRGDGVGAAVVASGPAAGLV